MQLVAGFQSSETELFFFAKAEDRPENAEAGEREKKHADEAEVQVLVGIGFGGECKNSQEEEEKDGGAVSLG